MTTANITEKVLKILTTYRDFYFDATDSQL